MSLHGSQTALNRRSVSDRHYTFRSSGDYSTRSDGAGDVFTSPIHLQYGAGGGDLHLSGQHPYGLGSGIGGGGELLGTTTRMTYPSKNPRISESRSYNMVETAPYSSKMDSLKRQHNWIQAMTDECANNLNRAEILLQETDFNI